MLNLKINLRALPPFSIGGSLRQIRRTSSAALLVFWLGLPTLCWSAATGKSLPTEAMTNRPNVLLIIADDLRDTVGCYGNPDIKTPNIDTLAARGLRFDNFYVQYSVCDPSRSSFLTGLRPEQTRVWDNKTFFRDNLPNVVTLPQCFREAGYYTAGYGKVFHTVGGNRGNQAKWSDAKNSWDDSHEASSEGGAAAYQPSENAPDGLHDKDFSREPKIVEGRNLTGGKIKWCRWGATAGPDNLEPDYGTASAAIVAMDKADGKPWFIAAGFHRPHDPFIAPKKYFDLYPLDEIKLPPIKDDDTNDLPPAIKKFYDHRKATIHDKLNEMGLMKEVLRAYLASISYADAMLGRVLDALDASAARDNTIVIFWSDQGYHHGEKGQWGKHTLWERTANIPFIWSGPGIARGANVNATVSAIDLYPTLVELCGLAPDGGLEGQSLATTLREPALAKDRNVLLCEIRQGGYAITNSQWRYIHYAEGGEELYDVVKDPNEWDNLALLEKYRPVMDELRQSAPKQFAAPGPESNALRLITEGESFHWDARAEGPKKKANKSSK
jgi:arylsulfatase A-like enzyme